MGYNVFIVLADKVGVTEMESRIQEEDTSIQDEIYKSRIASIKRVSLLPIVTSLVMPRYFIYWTQFGLGGGNSVTQKRLLWIGEGKAYTWIKTHKGWRWFSF